MSDLSKLDELDPITRIRVLEAATAAAAEIAKDRYPRIWEREIGKPEIKLDPVPKNCPNNVCWGGCGREIPPGKKGRKCVECRK